jgi:hypothetical protein
MAFLCGPVGQKRSESASRGGQQNACKLFGMSAKGIVGRTDNLSELNQILLK